MEQQKINLAHSSSIRRAYMSIYDWFKNPNQTFVSCFNSHLTQDVEQYLKEHNLSRRDYMDYCLTTFQSYTAMQTFSYLYELIRNNYNQTSLSKNKDLKILKQKIVSGTNNVNYDQLLDIIRQGLAHNDDALVNPNIVIDTRGNFTFKSRKFANNSITVSPPELIKILDVYMQHLTNQFNEQFTVSSDLNASLYFDKIKKGSRFIKLFNLNTNQEIIPDINQEKALINLIKDHKNGADISDENIRFYYPFKANYYNHAQQLVASMKFLRYIYKNRTQCLNSSFMDDIQKSDEDPDLLLGIETDNDFLAVFLHSGLYNLLVCTPPQTLQPILDEANVSIPANNLRNAFMHGTFFYDRNESFCLYDSKTKKEQALKHVGNITMSDLSFILCNAHAQRYNSATQKEDNQEK